MLASIWGSRLSHVLRLRLKPSGQNKTQSSSKLKIKFPSKTTVQAPGTYLQVNNRPHAQKILLRLEYELSPGVMCLRLGLQLVALWRWWKGHWGYTFALCHNMAPELTKPWLWAEVSETKSQMTAFFLCCSQAVWSQLWASTDVHCSRI